MSRRLALALAGALGSGLLAGAAHAQVDAALCAACHGPAGQGVAAMPTSPYLAGLAGPYLQRQLRDLADGARESPVMSVLAKAITPAKREVLAQYFAKLPRRGTAASGAARPSALGRQLAEHGLWSRGVPACVLCHGRQGVGVGSDFPPLAGQPSVYLVNQLRAFKTGARSAGPLGLMRTVASRLSERDMQAVAGYFSSLSPAVGARSAR